MAHRLWILAAVVFFARYYLPGTDLPVYTGDVYASHPARLAHGLKIQTPEWHGLSVAHTFTTRWVDFRPHIGTIDYEVALKARVSHSLTLSLAHGSTHNVDSDQGPVRRMHWLEAEWALP